MRAPADRCFWRRGEFMTRFIGAALVAALVSSPAGTARAEEGGKDAKAVIAKAIKAMGGEEKLAGVKAATWKTKGKIYIAGNESEFSSEATVEGFDHLSTRFEGEFGGMKVTGVTVVNGDKAWRSFNGNDMELDKDGVAEAKRTIYLQLVPVTVYPLLGKGFKSEVAGEDKVDGKPAVVLKVTGPDGKDFKLSFDKATGLPVKEVATVADFMGGQVTQETTYGDYKDMGGIKKATKIEVKREGDKFMEGEVTEFKPLTTVDPKTFAQPK